MWRSLNPGENVQKGDAIRYRLDPSNFIRSKEGVYYVVEADLHYFKISSKDFEESVETSELKIIKYTDVGYHISFEIWNDGYPFKREDTNQFIFDGKVLE